MSQQDNKRDDSSNLCWPKPAKEHVEVPNTVSSEAEFEEWLTKTLEAERKRLRQKSTVED